MTEQQFFRSKWKPFEVMSLYIKDLNRFCECYLIGIDFEERTMKVRPLDAEMYEDDIYEVSIDIVSRGSDPSKLKIVKK